MGVKESLRDLAVLEYKVCMHCGHLQSVDTTICDKCKAGAIGLGKPREFWIYLKLKIEGIITLPDAGYVTTFREEMVTGILDADEKKRRDKAQKKAKEKGVQKHLQSQEYHCTCPVCGHIDLVSQKCVDLGCECCSHLLEPSNPSGLAQTEITAVTQMEDEIRDEKTQPATPQTSTGPEA